MKNLIGKIIIKIVVSGLIPALIGVIITYCADQPIRTQIIVVVVIYIIIAIIVSLFMSFYEGWFVSRFDLWRIGKIRGLWKKRGLIKQIEQSFYSSNVVKIKVTRGYDLLQDANEYGFKAILDNLKQGKKKKHKDKVEVRFLLMIPCFQEAHIRERYERHTGAGEKRYLKSWYEFLKQSREYISEDLSINIRFYFGSHARWRFYIFSKPAGAKTDIFLSTYEKNIPGSEEPMYKIIKGEKNIGMFMTNYFDELWESALTPKKLYQYISSGKCTNGFCTHCTKGQKNGCHSCERLGCKYKKMCKQLSDDYKEELNKFNAK